MKQRFHREKRGQGVAGCQSRTLAFECTFLLLLLSGYCKGRSQRFVTERLATCEAAGFWFSSCPNNQAIKLCRRKDFRLRQCATCVACPNFWPPLLCSVRSQKSPAVPAYASVALVLATKEILTKIGCLYHHFFKASAETQCSTWTT